MELGDLPERKAGTIQGVVVAILAIMELGDLQNLGHLSLHNLSVAILAIMELGDLRRRGAYPSFFPKSQSSL